MYSTTRGDITIREMRESDIMPLIRAINATYERALPIINGLKEQIREKSEMSDLLFVILYKGKAVGKIDVEYTDKYCRDPKYRGIKTDGELTVEIPSMDICNKIAYDVGEMFIELCKEEGFVDVLGVPRYDLNGRRVLELITILPAAV